MGLFTMHNCCASCLLDLCPKVDYLFQSFLVITVPIFGIWKTSKLSRTRNWFNKLQDMIEPRRHSLSTSLQLNPAHKRNGWTMSALCSVQLLLPVHQMCSQVFILYLFYWSHACYNLQRCTFYCLHIYIYISA